MIDIKKDETGFTLIEMLIVIIIISTLLLIAVPSMSKSNDVVGSKSCDVTVKLLQSQVAAYNIEHEELPASLEILATEGYIDKATCPGGETLFLNDEGKVEIQTTETTVTTNP